MTHPRHWRKTDPLKMASWQEEKLLEEYADRHNRDIDEMQGKIDFLTAERDAAIARADRLAILIKTRDACDDALPEGEPATWREYRAARDAVDAAGDLKETT